MDKLQYDSFYKFLVSAGTVLIVAPILGVYYFLCNSRDLIIYKVDLDSLTDASVQLLHQREALLSVVLKYIPWVCLVLFSIGFICLIYGGIKWRKIQLELDEQTKLKTQEQQANVKALTASEIAEKVLNETIDDEEGKIAAKDPAIMITSERMLKAFQIQDKCFSYIKRTLSSKYYDVQQNIRINRTDFDIIARAKYENIDYIYEVKYFSKGFHKAQIRDAAQQLLASGNEYAEVMARNCEAILLIVVPDELYETNERSLYSMASTDEVKIMLLKESKL